MNNTTNEYSNKLVRALIIDDETDVCYLLGTLLKHKNLETSSVNSLSEATNAMNLSVPDIVFLDNHLPDGLGVNYVNVLKESYPNTKIVMITAHDTAVDRKLAMDIGVDYFIGKPFTRDDIYEVVDQLTNHRTN